MRTEHSNSRLEAHGAAFATTHWSVVLAAGQRETPQSAAALEQLCRTYWYPLYAYVRRRGYGPEDAQDLTQEFFARFLARSYLAGVDRQRGRFRSYLLGALNHFLADEWDRNHRLKRGGQVCRVPFDAASGEARYALEPAGECSPDRLFERRWVLALLDLVWRRLQQEHRAAGKVRRLRQDPQGRLLVIAQSADHYEAGHYYTPTHIAVWGTAQWRRQNSWTVPLGGGDAVSTDGRWLAAGGQVRRAIRVLSLSEPTQTHRLSFPERGVTDATFSPDGRLLAAANFGGTVKVWELPRFRECKEFQAHSRSLSALAFSPDSRRLAVAGVADEAIKLWDVGTWQELITLPHEKQTLQALRFTTDGNQLTAINSQGDFLFWCAPSFAEIAELEGQQAAAK